MTARKNGGASCILYDVFSVKVEGENRETSGRVPQTAMKHHI